MFTPGLRACAYETASGRRKWLNQDPIGEYGGINLYRAMNNNPVNYVDPYGLLGWSDFNPSLLWNGQAWSQLGSDIFMGNTSQVVDPNSYQALMANNGTPLLTPVSDQNGNQISNPASAVGQTVLNSLAQAAMMATPMGDEEAAAKGLTECEKAAQAAKAAEAAAADANKLNHIFGNAEHNLGPLLNEFGGNQNQAFTAIQQAAQNAINQGGITSEMFNQGIAVQVGTQTITVRGAIINGVANIGTAFK